jgi:hypothetical protein
MLIPFRFVAIGIIRYQQYSTISFHSEGKDPDKQAIINIDCKKKKKD